MGKRLKIALICLTSILILGIVGIVIAQNVLTSKIENFLSKSLPENIKVDYQDLDLSVMKGSLKLVRPKLTVYGKTTDSINLTNQMSSIDIAGIGYWDYLFNDKISIKEILISEPNIIYHYNKLIEKRAYQSKNVKKLNQAVHIGNFEITKGEMSMLDFATDSLLFQLKDFDFHLKTIDMNSDTVNQKIPFTFSDYNLVLEALFYQLNEYDNLKVGKSQISNKNMSFDSLKLYTKYSKQELSRIIPVERDHFDIHINSIAFVNQDFGFRQDSIFYLSCPNVVFNEPKMNIYRNKLINDDLSTKLLYSNMLRNLNFDLTLSEVLLENATINYSEKVKPESSAGLISFTELNATIKNLGNTFSSSEKTTIDIDAIFMKSTPINVNWYFDVNNVNDQFIFKAEVGRLPAQDLNPFSEPNLKVMFEGELLKTYFTIDGNFQNSTVDLRTNYDDFKVAVLDKDGKGKNKFLSAIANLFIKKDTEKSDDNFREGYKTDIERDKTKSVFNFLWLNARAGLLSAMTGNGKK